MEFNDMIRILLGFAQMPINSTLFWNIILRFKEILDSFRYLNFELL